MRVLVRVLVVAISVAIAIVAWRFGVRWQSHRFESGGSAAALRKDAVAKPRLAASELPGTWQGPIHRADGAEEWLVLEIRTVTQVRDDVTFDFTLSSSKEMQRGAGRASLADRSIRFAGMAGEIRDGKNGIVLRSVPIEGPPNWMLEKTR